MFIFFLRDRVCASLDFWLDAIPSAAVPAWAEALQHNTHLTNLDLTVRKFDVADVHAIRTALRLNASLTNVSLNLGGTRNPVAPVYWIGGIQLSTANLLPRGDRRRLRAILGLGLNFTAAGGDESDVNVADTRFFVPLADVTIGRQMGRGQFGVVCAGTCRGQPACIKRFLQHGVVRDTVDTVASRRYQRYLDSSFVVNEQFVAMRMQINELALLIEFDNSAAEQRLSEALKHTSVFATHFSIDDGDLLVVMPLMPGGVLKSSLATATLTDCVRWMLDVAEALRMLHRAGFVHRDVASRNILLDVVDGRLMAKLCDFGLSCAVEAPWLPDLAPLGIWPPEAVLSPSPSAYGTSGDVWAFGLMLVDVLRGGREQGSVDHDWLASYEQPELNALLDIFWDARDVSAVNANQADAAGSVNAALSVEEKQQAQSADKKLLLPVLDAATDPAARVLAICSESDWRERLSIPVVVLGNLPPALRSLLPLLVSCCTRVDALQRPSMELVALLLRQAHRGLQELESSPEQVVRGRLFELQWKFGDGILLGALCQCRGVPLDLGTTVNLKGDLHKPHESDGGARLLGGILNSRQVSLRLTWSWYLCCFILPMFCFPLSSMSSMLQSGCNPVVSDLARTVLESFVGPWRRGPLPFFAV